MLIPWPKAYMSQHISFLRRAKNKKSKTIRFYQKCTHCVQFLRCSKKIRKTLRVVTTMVRNTTADTTAEKYCKFRTGFRVRLVAFNCLHLICSAVLLIYGNFNKYFRPGMIFLKNIFSTHDFNNQNRQLPWNRKGSSDLPHR